MEEVWERIADNHNKAIETIIEFRKTAWRITEEEAERLRYENYFSSEIMQEQ